jgi:hypothetical protein
VTTDTSKKIAELNDYLRCEPENYGHLGLHVSTIGIRSLDIVEQLFIGHLVGNFDDFTPDNDPHGEHDFGAFEFNGHKIIWKIDYYDPTLQFGSEDPSSRELTKRVLTTMLASEY